MRAIRILHLSDLHLAKRRYERWRRIGDRYVLEELSRFVYERRTSIDAIVVTGDLAASGEREDLYRAAGFLSLSSVDGRPTLHAAGKPIVLLPGNHDRFTYSLRVVYHSDNFERVFGSLWHAGVGGVQPCFLPNPDAPALAILCADFTLGSVRDESVLGGRWGQGKVYDDRLQSLVRLTNELRGTEHSPAIVWALHFAPEFPGVSRLEELVDGQKLLSAAAGLDIRHIMCGHTHRKLFYPFQGCEGGGIHCAGTASCLKRGWDTSIHVLDFYIEGRTITDCRRSDYVWDEAKTTFLRVNRETGIQRADGAHPLQGPTPEDSTIRGGTPESKDRRQ